MAWYDRLFALLRREGKEAAETLRATGRRIDDALARKEREIAASPAERIDMLLEESEQADSEFEALEERIRRRTTPSSDAEQGAVEPAREEPGDG